jgi:hypothetical protein
MSAAVLQRNKTWIVNDYRRHDQSVEGPPNLLSIRTQVNRHVELQWQLWQSRMTLVGDQENQRSTRGKPRVPPYLPE